MNEIIQKILFNLERSETAYKLYAPGKKYYQALRIYKANQTIYALLIANTHLWTDIKEIMMKYLFHLEDWFEQFEEEVRIKKPNLDSTFSFRRFEDSSPFPAGIYESIKSLYPAI